MSSQTNLRRKGDRTYGNYKKIPKIPLFLKSKTSHTQQTKLIAPTQDEKNALK